MEALMPADFAEEPTNEMEYPIEGIFIARRRGENADATSIREEKHLGPRSGPMSPSARESSYHEACLRPSLSPFQKDGSRGSNKRV